MKIFYDFHIHTALSPCADDDNTPNNLINLAMLVGLNAIAISDHNSVGNVEVCQKLGEKCGIVVLPAIELTTAEDIHLLCLFKTFEGAKKVDNVVREKMIKLKNKPSTFGRQLIFDENDNIVGEELDLLILSSNISLEQARQLVLQNGGVPILAHINRTANSALAILGQITKDMGFNVVELSSNVSQEFIDNNEFLKDYIVLRDSDCHYLENLNQPNHFIEIEKNSPDAIVDYLLKN